MSLIQAISGIDPYNSGGKAILKNTVLLSNDKNHFSNFGYFATQNALLVESIINGRTLRDTVERLTVTKRDGENYEAYLQRVYGRHRAQDDKTSVVLVVYDHTAQANTSFGPRTVGGAPIVESPGTYVY